MEYLSLWGLFLSAFISSTLAPGGSEAVLGLMVNQGTFQVEQLISIATIGNTLGALTTWSLGTLAAKKYSPETVFSIPKQRSIDWVKKWGYWALLFSWLPIVGDGFCFAGGWLRLPILLSCLAIFIGKACRYCAIAYLVLI